VCVFYTLISQHNSLIKFPLPTCHSLYSAWCVKMDHTKKRASISQCCYHQNLHFSCFRWIGSPRCSALLVAVALLSQLALIVGQSAPVDARAVLIDPYRMSLALGAEGFANCSMDTTTLQGTSYRLQCPLGNLYLVCRATIMHLVLNKGLRLFGKGE